MDLGPKTEARKRRVATGQIRKGAVLAFKDIEYAGQLGWIYGRDTYTVDQKTFARCRCVFREKVHPPRLILMPETDGDHVDAPQISSALQGNAGQQIKMEAHSLDAADELLAQIGPFGTMISKQ